MKNINLLKSEFFDNLQEFHRIPRIWLIWILLSTVILCAYATESLILRIFILLAIIFATWRERKALQILYLRIPEFIQYSESTQRNLFWLVLIETIILIWRILK